MPPDPDPYEIRPAAGFNAFIGIYDLVCELVGLGRGFKRWLIDAAGIAPGQRILDVGCGTGTLAILAATRCPPCEVHAVDPDPKALAIAHRKAVAAQARIEWLEGRAEALPFVDAHFHRIFSSLAFHHIPRTVRPAAYAELARVMHTDGVLVFADFDPSRRPFRWIMPADARPVQQYLSEAGFQADCIGRRLGTLAYRATLARR